MEFETCGNGATASQAPSWQRLLLAPLVDLALPTGSTRSRELRTCWCLAQSDAIDPLVWSGRASQEVSSIWRLCGLASMYPASDWSGLCSGPSWISARVRSHYRTGLERAKRVTRVRMRREDRSSISFHPLADLGRKTGLCHRSLLDQCSSFVRAVRPFLRPGLHVVRGIARRGRQGWPSRLALHHVGVCRPRLDGPEHGATLTQVEALSRSSIHRRRLHSLLLAPCSR